MPNPGRPITMLLRELGEVIERLTDEQYVQKPVGVMPGSLGGHVRHCLDHVTALLGALETGSLDYDRRERGTAVEKSRAAALAAIHHAGNELSQITKEDIRMRLTVRVLMTAEAEAIDVGSTVGRELAYVLSHTIHHNAIIGSMVKTLGGNLPERFGYAPSTVRHARERQQD
jgi:uncharacterized damage-inducible protein DinB